jgi:hypothetical protein
MGERMNFEREKTIGDMSSIVKSFKKQHFNKNQQHIVSRKLAAQDG